MKNFGDNGKPQQIDNPDLACVALTIKVIASDPRLADVPEPIFKKTHYKVNILSRNIAQSITVIPNRSASSFISLSRVFGVSFAMALRCSTLLIPNLRSLGAMCSKEGSQLSKSASNCNVGWDFMLLIVEPDRVAWNGEGGSAFSTGVDAL